MLQWKTIAAAVTLCVGAKKKNKKYPVIQSGAAEVWNNIFPKVGKTVSTECEDGFIIPNLLNHFLQTKGIFKKKKKKRGLKGLKGKRLKQMNMRQNKDNYGAGLASKARL